MLIDLNLVQWKTLRALSRFGKETMGSALRLTPTRNTRDGQFLIEMVRSGLINVVKASENPFAAIYKITAIGVHAAEYGEFDIPVEQHREIIAARSQVRAVAAPKRKRRSSAHR